MTAELNNPLERIRRPGKVPVRRVWQGEASDFTPWLADNLDFLECLELGRLTLVDTEVTLPDTWRSLDLLSETGAGRRVAIENQFGAVDHDHLTRGLAYAVGIPRVCALVVIAEAHRPEFVAIADYLNRAAQSLGIDEEGAENGGVGVYLVEFRVEELEGWYLPRFEVVSRPNEWLESLGPAGRPSIGSIEDFYEQVDAARRAATREIVDHWDNLPAARVTHNAPRAIALRLRKPEGGDTAVFTIYDDGSLWLNRGYVVDALGIDRSEQVGELDDRIDFDLPDITRGEKNYILTLSDPQPEAVATFGEWIAGWFPQRVSERDE